MNFPNFDNNKEKAKPAKGKVLIAEPFLHDKDFARSVVFLCEHTDEGTIGFVLNQPTSLTLGDLLVQFDNAVAPLTIYSGGPVQPDTLHIIHRMPGLLGGHEIADGIYWGGSYESLQEVVIEQNYDPNDIRLFVGYSGWSTGQLHDEIEEGAWLVGEISQELFFETDANTAWKKAIKMLGDDYAFLANMPIDPQLN